MTEQRKTYFNNTTPPPVVVDSPKESASTTIARIPEYQLGTKKGNSSLRKVCKADISAFATLGDTTVTKDGPYTFIDNGADIIAVGHLDWVLEQEPRFLRKKKGIQHVQCGQLDDRLGVWGILLGLEGLVDVKYDILLTDSEEVGASTAQYFEHPEGKIYNWGFELDRAGTDCVLYDYKGLELDDYLKEAGWFTNRGSFSDIQYMTELGFQCVNFGIGYQRQHTKECYAPLHVVSDQLQRIASFINKHHDIAMPYDYKTQKPTFYYGRNNYNSGNPYGYNYDNTWKPKNARKNPNEGTWPRGS